MIKNSLAVFESKKIRRHYDEAAETWYFSIVDVVSALTDSVNPRDYWFKMKLRVKSEDGIELSPICRQLKMKAPDGKMRETDVANVEGLLRIIQSIPSPKAEPFKLWLAKVGYERIQDMNDPSLSLDWAREYWQKLGRSEKWIQQRMMGQETRNKLTDCWKDHEVTKEEEYAILTNIIHQEWSGVSVKKHKEIKKLKSQNHRDHMNEAELIFTALAELSTKQMLKALTPRECQRIFTERRVEELQKKARLELEEKTGKSIITSENYLPPSRKQKPL